MRLLLDTHALLWFLNNDTKLSITARTAIEDTANDVFVSIASAWEVAIKVSIGKLALGAPSAEVFFEEQMETNTFAFLHIEPSHVFQAAILPFYHRDPFDRLIIAQALIENMALVTREDFRAYGVSIIW